jgi:hypothetical protein
LDQWQAHLFPLSLTNSIASFFPFLFLCVSHYCRFVHGIKIALLVYQNKQINTCSINN